MECDRCGTKTFVSKGSMFNKDMLCMGCIEKEKKHPDYDRARQVEHEEVKKGNYNFEGVGKPIDL